ncbi:MAG: KH domain-containing protein [Deltaproteobacteria bacterium]|nr:MAG: KH domain-containing protein [Deltaproteobacteria bacterium]
MQDLVHHLVRPIVANPDDVSVQTVEGESVVMLELVVHADDHDKLTSDDGRTLRALRTVLSAAAGKRKATLDLVEEHGALEDGEE